MLFWTRFGSKASGYWHSSLGIVPFCFIASLANTSLCRKKVGPEEDDRCLECRGKPLLRKLL